MKRLIFLGVSLILSQETMINANSALQATLLSQNNIGSQVIRSINRRPPVGNPLGLAQRNINQQKQDSQRRQKMAKLWNIAKKIRRVVKIIKKCSEIKKIQQQDVKQSIQNVQKDSIRGDYQGRNDDVEIQQRIPKTQVQVEPVYSEQGQYEYYPQGEQQEQYEYYPEQEQYAPQNIIRGSPNYIRNGRRNIIDGQYNEIQDGDDNMIIGKHNKISNSDNNFIHGTGNVVMSN